MASVSAAVAAQVMQNIFKYFGPLVNIDPILGTPASPATLITMRTSTGYTIPAGTRSPTRFRAAHRCSSR